MAVETKRVRSARRIPVPGYEDDYHWDVWVIDEITFQERSGIRQEWVFKFDNSPDSAREVHTREVEVGGGTLKVEDIDKYFTQERNSIRQESAWALLGNKEDPTVHFETHEVTIKARDSNNDEVEGFDLTLERIDKILFEERTGVWQETEWTLLQQDDDDKIEDGDVVDQWDETQINPPWRLDPFQNVKETEDARCMLLMYGGNSVVALNMKDIDKATWNPVYRKTLQSSWNEISAGGCTQLRFGKNTHVFSCLLKFNSDGSVTDYSNQDEYACTFYNAAYSIFKPAAQVATNYGGQLFNGNETTIYASSGERFKVAQNGAITNDGMALDIVAANPAGISSGGQYYGGMVLSAGNVNAEAGAALTQAQIDAYYSSRVVPGLTTEGYSAAFGPGDGFQSTIVTNEVDDGNYGGGGGHTSYLMVYSNDGSKDIITLQPFSGSYSSSGTSVNKNNPDYYETWHLARRITFMGVSGGYDFDNPGGPKRGEVSYVYPEGFPYPQPPTTQTFFGLAAASLIGDYNFDNTFNNVWSIASYWNSNGTVRQEFNSPYPKKGFSRCFVANGKYYMHIVEVGGEGDFYYLNKSDVTNKFKSILGSGKVQIALFDIKLSEIKKLK